MSKKFSFGKLIGIIFCIIAAAGTVVLLCVNIYFGGQIKTIDKCFTAIERDDYDSFKSCFSADDSEIVTEEYFSASKEMLSLLAGIEDGKTAVSFVSREKLDGRVYTVTVDLTVYNDSKHQKNENIKLGLVREKGKWYISI